ncbi:L-ribulose-5-phosphate 4-epimerase [Novipirellula artificiosorum]|uniref:L-ribulose-5-phosphate 4-epimerase n=1 Tax=Novipirellula artificiosorum TaxID=2528016 RepID=A0A5C6E1Z4_9BACT|nr:L-ribulose-5-phosphate 4-epimerase [Novipirellula artificiosorum]TWU41997.1 L-ribulose-5-phosphate 4-epimerase UlaF [Novipirellula artificiosorum]
MLEKLKEQVFVANLELVQQGLVTLTWGNVSGIDRDKQRVVIKPSGVAYDEMEPSYMVVVDLEGNVIEGDYNPSTDTATHLLLYRQFKDIGGITHTHSSHAVMFAQARCEIPCFGTTHADHFYGPVPVTRPLTSVEVEEDYEVNTAKVILDRFADLDPNSTPAVLVAGHGPFTWGSNARKSVENAVALEAVAQMALGTTQINAQAIELESYVLEKHYQRKHGPGAYYGQKKA